MPPAKDGTQESHSGQDGIGQSSGSGVAEDEAPERRRRARRTFLTQSACTRCRHKKSKCDGIRPTCGRCERSGVLECEYDVVHEGMTRMQSLQQQLDVKVEDYDRLMSLLNALHNGTDQEATTLLARLRLGESVDELIHSVQTNRSWDQSMQHRQQPHLSGLRSPRIDESRAVGHSWTSWSSRCESGGEDSSSQRSTIAREGSFSGASSASSPATSRFPESSMKYQHRGSKHEQQPLRDISIKQELQDGPNKPTSLMQTNTIERHTQRQPNLDGNIDPQLTSPDQIRFDPQQYLPPGTFHASEPQGYRSIEQTAPPMSRRASQYQSPPNYVKRENSPPTRKRGAESQD